MRNVTGKELRKARHVKEMKQDETSKLLGINRSYLSLIENEKVVPSDKLQKKIDYYFGDIVDRFFFEY